jgi:hypothetical protein
MTIRKQTQPNMVGQPVLNLDKDSFDGTIWNKGYRILLEEARQCACRSQEVGSALLTCRNCRGTGWFFINPIETRAIISSIKKTPKYSEWSEESMGTISATLRSIDKIAEMDRITFLDSVSKRSEKLEIREEDGQKFVFLSYKPNEILDVFYFKSSNEPLVKLPQLDYSIDENPYILLLDIDTPANNIVTVTYTCYSTYHCIDLPHDLRNSTFINNLGQIEKIELPVNAILRKAHTVLNKNDFGNGIQTIDNSYK